MRGLSRNFTNSGALGRGRPYLALTLLTAGGLAASAASTAATEADASEIQVTATRIPESTERLPASVTVIRGDDLRDRGAADLRTALALVAGTDAPPGGDAGPASSVPSLWGLHEFDAFLLVVDGVPWGGAFNPALSSLDLHDVERVEILKGAAPVMYGATSFVGVIQVIRRPAGTSDDDARMAAGSRASLSGDLSISLPELKAVRESLLIDGERTRLTGPRQGIDTGHVLYRAAAPLAAGAATLDAELVTQAQLPTSPVVRAGTHLTSLTPLDANLNPLDAGIHEHRVHLTAAYAQMTDWGEWHALASLAHSRVHDVRGFVRPELALGDDGNNADGFNQDRTIDDDYLDLYAVRSFSRALSLTAGLDCLYGRGSQQSRNFAYVADLGGAVVPPPSGARHVDEINGLENKRDFAGLYLQSQWKPTERLEVMAGGRFNRTSEDQLSTHIDTIDAGNDFAVDETRTHLRGSGAAGASYLLWGVTSPQERGVLFADYRDTFKPAAIDFGPDVTPDILRPETAKSYEAGVRLRSAGGALAWEAAAFHLDFSNLVVQQTDVNGAPILANAGSEHFRGIETEVRWSAPTGTLVMLSYSYHDAYYGNTLALESGSTVQLAGHQLDLSPHNLAAIGLERTMPLGLQGALQVAYVGRRFLDRLNTAPIGGYLTLDARLAYRFKGFSIALNGYNLTDRRDPVTESEFGDQSYYRLPARRVMLEVYYSLR